MADLVQDTTILDKVKTADTSSEIDLEETVEQIRQHTLKTMKPEIAPWAKDYTPKMEDIHTKLLVRNRHRDTGVELSHYEKLFASGKSKKILVRGRLGTGKSLLGKKIAHD